MVQAAFQSLVDFGGHRARYNTRQSLIIYSSISHTHSLVFPLLTCCPSRLSCSELRTAVPCDSSASSSCWSSPSRDAIRDRRFGERGSFISFLVLLTTGHVFLIPLLLSLERFFGISGAGSRFRLCGRGSPRLQHCTRCIATQNSWWFNARSEALNTLSSEQHSFVRNGHMNVVKIILILIIKRPTRLANTEMLQSIAKSPQRLASG